MAEEYVKAALSLIGISTVAAVCRSILTEERRSFHGFVRATVLAVFVGGVAGALLQSSAFSSETQGGIIGLCAFVADDILLAVVALSTMLRNDPSRVLGIVLNRKDGGKTNGTDSDSDSTKR